MIINDTPKDKAEFGGVTGVSEFRIRNSAKAFGILSSGLYANKIRAIVRELSTNAVDSHRAAGCADRPFDLHLPTELQPYFAIRDYGVGLNHDEVSNIYTTYFESTKTDSNDYIGALGLGSKSPFGYTDNFTVTAIKDGRQGVYSAFINDTGVPSVALMSESKTDEPNGVEVRFAVADYNDSVRFRNEAASVYRYFPVLPNVTGAKLNVQPVEYKVKDLIPGVHQRDNSMQSSNYAVMGNIAYPIDLDQQLHQLKVRKEENAEIIYNINRAELDLHFELGEIDIQPSREGLQYTDYTVNAIIAKYLEVAVVLQKRFAKDIEKLPGAWERTAAIIEKYNNMLWRPVIGDYINKTKPVMLWNSLDNRARYLHDAGVNVNVADIAEKYNVSLRGFSVGRRHYTNYTASEIAECTFYDHDKNQSYSYYDVECSDTVNFIRNPNGKMVWERSKKHFKARSGNTKFNVFVVSPADNSKPADVDAFLDEVLHSPPANQILDVDDLDCVTRANKASITVLKLKCTHYLTTDIDRRVTWNREPDFDFDDIDDNKICCYVPLSGFEAKLRNGKRLAVKHLFNSMYSSDVPGFKKVEFYGIRKDGINEVESRANWVHVEDYVESVLSKFSADMFIELAVQKLTNYSLRDLRSLKKRANEFNQSSKMRELIERLPEYTDDTKDVGNMHRNVNSICNVIGGSDYIKQMKTEAEEFVSSVNDEYAILNLLRPGNIDSDEVIQYIKLIDNQTQESL